MIVIARLLAVKIVIHSPGHHLPLGCDWYRCCSDVIVFRDSTIYPDPHLLKIIQLMVMALRWYHSMRMMMLLAKIRPCIRTWLISGSLQSVPLNFLGICSQSPLNI